MRDNDWDKFYDLIDVDEAWDYMLDIIGESIEFFCPTKEIKIKKLKEKPVTQELLEFINDKDDLLRLAKRTNHNEDWNTSRIAQNLVAGMVRNAKKDCLQEKINQNHENPHKFWKAISKLLPDSKSSISIVLKNHTNDGKEINNENILNFINNFFTTIGSNLASTNKDTTVTWQYTDLELPPVFKLTSVIEYNVLREVQKLKVTKSSAIPNISTKILKDAFEALVQQLTFLCNLSIFTCTFPTKWKCTNVTPLFKAGDPTDVNNYRPISQLPTPSKVLEHLNHTQVMNYFDI